MSNTIQLKAQQRDRVGKGAARELRRNKLVPAVIYGDNKDPLPIALDYKELDQRLRAGGFMTTVTEIEVNGEKHRVLAKDYQLDPVRDFIQHVDFFRITKGVKVVLDIPVNFINDEECPGIKRGGVLNIVRYTVEVECRASEIPENLTADLINLDLGDSLHISEIDLPEGVEPTITDRDFTICTVAAPAGLKEELKGEEEEGDETEAGEVPTIGDEEAAAEEGKE